MILAGCYIGQETIARLITYDGVKQQLWGVLMDGPADPETAVYVDGTKVGLLDLEVAIEFNL